MLTSISIIKSYNEETQRFVSFARDIFNIKVWKRNFQKVQVLIGNSVIVWNLAEVKCFRALRWAV